jgi:hypothetical protein
MNVEIIKKQKSRLSFEPGFFYLRWFKTILEVNNTNIKAPDPAAIISRSSNKDSFKQNKLLHTTGCVIIVYHMQVLCILQN